MKKRKLQTWKRNGNVIKGSRASGGAKRGQVSFCAPNDGLQESPIYWHQRGYRSLLVHGSPKVTISLRWDNDALFHILEDLEKQSAESSTSSIGSSDVAIVDGKVLTRCTYGRAKRETERNRRSVSILPST